VLNLPLPQTQKVLLQFISLTNYFRNHCPDMTEMVKPLRDMIPLRAYKNKLKAGVDWTNSSSLRILPTGGIKLTGTVKPGGHGYTYSTEWRATCSPLSGSVLAARLSTAFRCRSRLIPSRAPHTTPYILMITAMRFRVIMVLCLRYSDRIAVISIFLNNNRGMVAYLQSLMPMYLIWKELRQILKKPLQKMIERLINLLTKNR